MCTPASSGKVKTRSQLPGSPLALRHTSGLCGRHRAGVQVGAAIGQGLVDCQRAESFVEVRSARLLGEVQHDLPALRIQIGAIAANLWRPHGQRRRRFAQDRQRQSHDVVVGAHIQVAGGRSIGAKIAHRPGRVGEALPTLLVEARRGHLLECQVRIHVADVLRQALRPVRSGEQPDTEHCRRAGQRQEYAEEAAKPAFHSATPMGVHQGAVL